MVNIKYLEKINDFLLSQDNIVVSGNFQEKPNNINLKEMIIKKARCNSENKACSTVYWSKNEGFLQKMVTFCGSGNCSE